MDSEVQGTWCAASSDAWGAPTGGGVTPLWAPGFTEAPGLSTVGSVRRDATRRLVAMRSVSVGKLVLQASRRVSVTRKSLFLRSSVWIVGSVVGAVIVALPDSDQRVLSFSRTHGPSPLDLLGVAILVGCWLPIAFVMPSLWRAMAGAPARVAAAVAVLGAAALVITIGADMGRVWLVAAGALVVAQIIVLADAWRIAGPHSMPRK